jgi:hypothetical protein
MPCVAMLSSRTGDKDAARLAPPRYALSLGNLLAVAGAKLTVHLATGGRYGYFRDELYHLDAGWDLAFGYADFAPLVAPYARIGLWLGGSLHAIRLIPALAGAGAVALTVVLAWELGGGRFAQGLAGLVWFFVDRRRRLLGWVYVVFPVAMFALHAKHYYLLPIYPLLFAGGAVAIERWLGRSAAQRGGRGRLRPEAGIAAAIALAGVPVDRFMLPILSPRKHIEYEGFLRLQALKSEVRHESLWPQVFTDQMGWAELVGEVARIYWSLPAEESAPTGIFANNYGEAGALDEFGPRSGQPPAISAHQNYYSWGWHGFRGKNLIVLQGDARDLERSCGSVEAAGRHDDAYGMAEENQTIYRCRGIKFNFAEAWPHLKHWN